MGIILEKIRASHNDNLETFSLLWLDAAVNQTEDNKSAQERLQTTINQLKTFEDPVKCKDYIKNSSTDDRIVLIVSGQMGRQVLPDFHDIEQLLSIYVYCYNQELNEQWSAPYPKVKAVVTDLKELIVRIQFDHEKRQQSRIYEPLPISIFDPNIVYERLTTDLQGHLVHSQLLINCLLNMDPDPNDKENLIDLSKKIYKKNQAELKVIHTFEQTYSSTQALSWYTKDSFMSRLLNKALRTQNIDLLFLFQFFIADIGQNLERIKDNKEITVYRSQLMSKNELKNLKDSIQQFISINSFLSAVKSSKTAKSHFQNSETMEKVLFVINADSKFSGNKPFADIKQFSSTNEDEVLFMLGSIFQIIEVTINEKHIWRVKLKLFSNSREQMNSMQNQNNKELFAFGHVLMTTGNLEEANIYYRRLLKKLSENNVDQARCYEALGNIAEEKNDFENSLLLYNRSLLINKQIHGEKGSFVASNLNNIGEIYRKKRDFSKAFKNYQMALLALEQENLSTTDLRKKALVLNNIGIYYQDTGDYNEAFNYYTQAYKIRKDLSPPDETSIGMSFNNIGNALYLLKKYDDALEHYQKALKNYRKNLPPQHPKLASVYNNIGAMYDDQNNKEQALCFYEKAHQIYATVYPPTNSNVIKIKENIQRLESQAKS